MRIDLEARVCYVEKTSCRVGEHSVLRRRQLIGLRDAEGRLFFWTSWNTGLRVQLGDWVEGRFSVKQVTAHKRLLLWRGRVKEVLAMEEMIPQMNAAQREKLLEDLECSTGKFFYRFHYTTSDHPADIALHALERLADA